MLWLLLILIIPYIFLLLRIYISLRKIKPQIILPASETFLSVIVACRNEERNLPSLLSGIASQNYNPDKFELIVVDDNSDDSTFEIASEFKGIENIKVLKNSASGKKRAIYEGVKACTGDIVITTDADCRMSRKWLKTISSSWSENRPELIIGPVMLDGGRGFFQRFQELEFISLQCVTAGTAASGDPVMCNGANLAFSRDAYLKSSEDLHPELVSGDDIFLLHSIKKRAGRILWLESEDANITAKSALTQGAFIKQRARWISKSGSYDDRYTKLLAIVTFVTIFFLVFLLVAGIFNSLFLLIYLAGFFLKSIPDFMVLYNRAAYNRKKNLLWFFLPGQLIYPFYVLSVVTCWLFTKSRYSQPAAF
jgi:biofilm PGA synthesis N-glycosyltransferase PgaC